MRFSKLTASAPSFPAHHDEERVRLQLRARGFTLLEILVVLAIIGLVAGLAISKIGGIYDSAKIQTADLFVRTSVKLPLNAYKIAMSDFPSTAEGLQALITAPARGGGNWRGPYLESNKVPLDPWNEPYQYEYPGQHNKGSFDIWSKGPDRQSGTDDDIGNWENGPKDK